MILVGIADLFGARKTIPKYAHLPTLSATPANLYGKFLEDDIDLMPFTRRGAFNVLGFCIAGIFTVFGIVSVGASIFPMLISFASFKMATSTLEEVIWYIGCPVFIFYVLPMLFFAVCGPVGGCTWTYLDRIEYIDYEAAKGFPDEKHETSI